MQQQLTAYAATYGSCALASSFRLSRIKEFQVKERDTEYVHYNVLMARKIYQLYLSF